MSLDWFRSIPRREGPSSLAKVAASFHKPPVQSQEARIRNLLAYSTPGAPPITLDDTQAQELLQELAKARAEGYERAAESLQFNAWGQQRAPYGSYGSSLSGAPVQGIFGHPGSR